MKSIIVALFATSLSACAGAQKPAVNATAPTLADDDKPKEWEENKPASAPTRAEQTKPPVIEKFGFKVLINFGNQLRDGSGQKWYAMHPAGTPRREFIITLTGKEIVGAPMGLNCGLFSYDCSVIDLVKNDEAVYLIASNQIYRYDNETDNFVMVMTLESKNVRVMSTSPRDQDGIYALVPSDGSARVVGLLYIHTFGWQIQRFKEPTFDNWDITSIERVEYKALITYHNGDQIAADLRTGEWMRASQRTPTR